MQITHCPSERNLKLSYILLIMQAIRTVQVIWSRPPFREAEMNQAWALPLQLVKERRHDAI